MMKNILLSLMMTILLVGSAAAQQTTIKGKVTDAQNEPLIGAGVVVDGTNIGAITDLDGNYTLVISAGTKVENLIFSYLGYDTIEVAANGKTVVDAVLTESAENIEEVVLIGYGSMRKSDVAGSVASVNIDQEAAMRATSFDQLIKGRVAGVQVTTANAAPGGAIDIKIRGNSTFNGTGEPLYVVDGIILNTDESTTSSMGDYEEPINALTGISPQDIESMEILKDASATAIYGSMGANGVVIITTKQGVSDKPRITWNTGVSVSQASNRLDVLSFDEWLDYQADRGSDTTGTVYNPDGSLSVTPMDWQDYVLRSAVSTQNRVSISARDKKTSYMVAFGHNLTNGIVENSNIEEFNIRANVDRTFSDAIKVGSRTSLSRSTTNMIQSTSSTSTVSSSLIRSMLSFKPYYDWDEYYQVESGDLDPDDAAVTSGPVLWLSEYTDHSVTYRVTPSAYLEATFNDNFSYKFSVGGDFRSRERTRFKGSGIGNTAGANSLSMQNSMRYNMDNTVTYNQRIGKHRITAMVGTTFNNSYSETTSVYGEYTTQEGLLDYNINSSLYQDPTEYDNTENALLSYFARTTYNFDHRYVLTATYRIDGSSRFTKANRYAHFPSFAFAWRATEEEFITLPRAISDMKVRLGWGMVGSQSVAAYSTLSNYGSVLLADHTNVSGSVVGTQASNIANEDLKWETTEQYNIGLDLSFFNDNVTFTADFYDKRTKDLLQNLTIPISSGFSNMWVNRGVIQNKGMEFSIDALVYQSRDFSFSASGNISFNRNKILDTGIEDTIDDDGLASYFFGQDIGSSNEFNEPANIFIEGQAMGLFYGLATDGIIQEGETGNTWMGDGAAAQPGEVNYIDQNGDGDITADDKVIIGDPNADFTYGFNFGFTYKSWKLDMAFEGSYGNEIVNATRMKGEDVNSSTNVFSAAYYGAWTPENCSETYPALNSYDQYGYFSDRIVEDGSYLRMSNLSLSYSMKLRKLAWAQSLSISASVSNVFVITDYSGWDPEVNSFSKNMFKMGVDLNSYPQNRTYSLGLSINF